MIGLKRDDSVAKAYLSRLASPPDEENAPGYGVFVSLNHNGIELSADRTGTITTVVIFSSLSEDYDKYPGPMPLALSWDMSRSEVENIIGQPTKHSFTRNSLTGNHEFFAEYPALDIYLNYLATSESDMQAKLIDMRIKNSQL